LEGRLNLSFAFKLGAARLSSRNPRVLPKSAFARFPPGARPRSSREGYRTPIEIEGVRISPGDLIFGDREGVLVIPSEVEGEAVAAALAKASTESKVATAIRGGMSAREAFERFGVL
jgi:regulator of RNase E activity RraA